MTMTPTRLIRQISSSALLGLMLFGATGFGSAAAATAANNTVPAAVANLLVREPDVAPCAENAHAASNEAFANANFELSTVKLKNGLRMSVVPGGGSCVCGNANCKVEVFKRDGDAYRSVLSDYAIHSDVQPDGTAVITSHDSADVSDRTTYRWNGKVYFASKREIVYLEKNVAKPASRDIRFAPGTSSATLNGKQIALGFEDRFTFDAAAGQRVTLTLRKHDSRFGSFSVVHGSTTLATAQRGTLKVTLPASGTYNVVVEGSDESFSAYELVLTIH